MAEEKPQPNFLTLMKQSQLIVNRWGREYRCYNAIIKYLKLNTNEIFRFRKAVKCGKIRFFREVPHVDDFEHRFFHEGDVRKVIDAYRSRKKERVEPKQKKLTKKRQKQLLVKNRQDEIFNDMLKKQEEVIAKSLEEQPTEEVVEEKLEEEQKVEIIEENEPVEETEIGHWLGVYERMFSGESVSDEMVSFY